MASQPYIWFRGKRMTPAVRDALLAAEQRAGFKFTISQGGWNAGGVAASAGTHDGDALDLRTWDIDDDQVAAMVEAMRWAGFAAWLRTTKKPRLGVRTQGFETEHVHAVPNGWGAPSAGAKRQAAKYRAGRDGLRGNRKDDGRGHTRQFVDKTRPEKPKEWDEMASKEEIKAAMREVLAEQQQRRRAQDDAQTGVERALWTKVIPDHVKSKVPTVARSSFRNVLAHIVGKLG